MPIEEADQIVAAPALVRAMRFRDVVLFLIITGFSVRWIANASVAGPSAAIVWIGACLTFYIPLVFTVLELSSRYPDEGGIYVWTKQAFGGFSGFITGWTYWASNLPYFPSLLYFMAANALYLSGAHARTLAASPVYFVLASILGPQSRRRTQHRRTEHQQMAPQHRRARHVAAHGDSDHAQRDRVGTVWLSHTSHPRVVRPGCAFKDVIFWSTVAFSLTGAESASMLGDEIENPRRTLPRALLLAGLIIPLIYIVPTIGILVALTPDHVTIISGFMDSITIFAARLHVGWIVAVCAALITVGSIGQCGAWVAASARLPFVAGIDRYLPAAFGQRSHPQWGTPYVSLIVLGVISVAFILLSQLGTGVSGAYNVMVSVSVITFLIPVPAHVRGRDPAAEPPNATGCLPCLGRTPRCDTARRGRLHDHRGFMRPLPHPRPVRPQPRAVFHQGRWIDRGHGRGRRGPLPHGRRPRPPRHSHLATGPTRSLTVAVPGRGRS